MRHSSNAERKFSNAERKSSIVERQSSKVAPFNRGELSKKDNQRDYSSKSSERSEQIDQIAHHYEQILKLIGENTEREGIIKTPKRAAEALAFFSKVSCCYLFDFVCCVQILIFYFKGLRREA